MAKAKPKANAKSKKTTTPPKRKPAAKRKTTAAPVRTAMSVAANADDAGPAADLPIEHGLRCVGFTLQLVQNFSDPGLPVQTDIFKLRVIADNGKRYKLVPATIPDEQPTIDHLLHRIADNHANAGWTFDGQGTKIVG
jgi:hypothetical protein